MKYIYIIKFLLRSDLANLKECLSVEYLKSDFNWFRLLKKIIRNRHKNNYLLWYRVAYFMYRSDNVTEKKYGKRLANELNEKHCIDISIIAEIDVGLKIWHLVGIVITPLAKIGRNCSIAGNVTIGLKSYLHKGEIQIGDNVTLSAYSMIFGQNIIIGNNVIIGAMSFINKNIPDNCTVYTQKTNTIIQKI